MKQCECCGWHDIHVKTRDLPNTSLPYDLCEVCFESDIQNMIRRNETSYDTDALLKFGAYALNALLTKLDRP